MIHNWLLVVERESISISSKFYVVSVGSSKKAQADWAYLNLFAAIHNYFFEKWSKDIDDFLWNVAHSLNCQFLDLNLHHISVRELVAYIEEHGETPRKPLLSKESVRVRQLFRPSSYFQVNLDVIRHAEAKQRNKPKARDKGEHGFS